MGDPSAAQIDDRLSVDEKLVGLERRSAPCLASDVSADGAAAERRLVGGQAPAREHELLVEHARSASEVSPRAASRRDPQHAPPRCLARYIAASAVAITSSVRSACHRRSKGATPTDTETPQDATSSVARRAMSASAKRHRLVGLRAWEAGLRTRRRRDGRGRRSSGTCRASPRPRAGARRPRRRGHACR